MRFGSRRMLFASGRLPRGVVLGLLLLRAVAAGSSADSGASDGGVSKPCQQVRGEAYRRSLRAHVLVKYGLEFEKCALPNTEVLRFEIWVGGQPTVRFQSGTKEQMSCVRGVLTRVVLPKGVRRLFEFRFDGKPSRHDSLTFAEIADAGVGAGRMLGFCEYDADCWPDGVCSCGSDYCSVFPDGPNATETRGVCVSIDAISCVQEVSQRGAAPR